MCVACRSMAEGAADTLKAGTDMSCAGDAPIIFPPAFLHILCVCFLTRAKTSMYTEASSQNDGALTWVIWLWSMV